MTARGWAAAALAMLIAAAAAGADVSTLAIPVDLKLVLASPQPILPGNTIRCTATITNKAVIPISGALRVRLDGAEIAVALPAVQALARNAELQGSFTIQAPAPGAHALVLQYWTETSRGVRVPTRGGKLERRPVFELSSETSAAFSVTAPPVDSDRDGITDDVEAELLARFRPFYRFSKYYDREEQIRPADARWFVRHSELQDHHSETDTPVFRTDQLDLQPELILKASSLGSPRLSVRAGESDYYLNVDNRFRGGESDWNVIESKAVGLYGHVAPLPDSYKIEYWQFYAFNPIPGQVDCWIVRGPAGGGSDAHEGDWESVQLVVALDRKTIRHVRHNIHDTDVVFHLQGTPKPLGGGFIEYQGPDARTTFDLHINKTSEARHDSLLRLYCDAGECTHPVVYIEHGGHASWPTEYWFFPGVLNHDGNSAHAYLVAPPVNLGEVGRPNPACPACELIVEFNGHWGACGKDPPHGPPLQGSWGKP